MSHNARSEYQTAQDIPVYITSQQTSSERRISPAWTVSHFKNRLEPITGIPASSQRLELKVTAQPESSTYIFANNEDAVQLSNWELTPYAEIHVG